MNSCVCQKQLEVLLRSLFRLCHKCSQTPTGQLAHSQRPSVLNWQGCFQKAAVVRRTEMWDFPAIIMLSWLLLLWPLPSPELLHFKCGSEWKQTTYRLGSTQTKQIFRGFSPTQRKVLKKFNLFHLQKDTDRRGQCKQAASLLIVFV